MNIAVINGSPKPSETSVTMRHIEFLKNSFKDHTFEEIPVALKIRKLEINKTFFNEVIEIIAKSDIVIWATPVYFYSVTGQIKRFVELIYEHNAEEVFKGKYSTVVATSGGVYDYPALEYIHAISEDLGMEYFPGCSFKSLYHKDLLKKDVRENFSAFFTHLIQTVEERIHQIKKYPPLNYSHVEFVPIHDITIPTKKSGKKLLVLTDQIKDSNLEKMVEFSLGHSGCKSEIININDIDLRSGCIGCVQCQFHGKCVIKDDVNELFGKKLLEFDAVLFAMTMKDRHISARWKMLIDRTLFVAKKDVYRDIHAAFIISGPAREGGFVHEFAQIYYSSRCFHGAGVVTDESGNSLEISKNLISLMNQLETNVSDKIKRPYLFHRRAYHMAMRELMYIYGLNSHTAKFYKKNGLFDYPHSTAKHIMTRNMLNFFFTFPLTKKHFRKNLNNISADQYRKVTA